MASVEGLDGDQLISSWDDDIIVPSKNIGDKNSTPKCSNILPGTKITEQSCAKKTTKQPNPRAASSVALDTIDENSEHSSNGNTALLTQCWKPALPLDRAVVTLEKSLDVNATQLPFFLPLFDGVFCGPPCNYKEKVSRSAVAGLVNASMGGPYECFDDHYLSALNQSKMEVIVFPTTHACTTGDIVVDGNEVGPLLIVGLLISSVFFLIPKSIISLS